jgi:uncharacterized protein (UPF0248 family)
MVLGVVANFMNRIKWNDRLPESEVVILHRGSPDDRKRISGEHITEIKKGHFCYIDADHGREVVIPMHRVLEILMDEELVWKKRASRRSALNADNGPANEGSGKGAPKSGVTKNSGKTGARKSGRKAPRHRRRKS